MLVRWLARLGQMLLLIWLVITALFAGLALLRGNPIDLYLDPRISAETKSRIKQRFGYDTRLAAQYARYLGNACRGELGVSFIHKKPVTRVLAERIPRTLWLGTLAYLTALAFTLALLWCFDPQGGAPRWLRRLAEPVFRFWLVMPSFLFAIMLLHVAAIRWHLFPVYGSHRPGADPSFWDLLHHSVLPALSIAMPLAAYLTAYLRARLEPLAEAPFVLSALGRGVSPTRVFFNHKLRVVRPLILQLTGLYLPVLISGMIIVESIFGWSGMGLLLLDALTGRDYPLLLGGCLWMTCVTVAGYQLADYQRARHLAQAGAA